MAAAIKSVAFLYPGDMGGSLARLLHTASPHLKLFTCVKGRSQATVDRATAAGLQDVSMQELVHSSDVIFSILPPSSAMDIAKEIISHLPTRSAGYPPIYIDGNAVAPSTMTKLKELLEGHKVPLLDGCVIGGPAKEGYKPKIYLSADSEWKSQLGTVAEALSAGDKGWKIEVLQDGGLGAASALKMCYGGINKGSQGLAALLVMAAQAHSSATADALIRETADSQTAKLDGWSRGFPSMIPKAYRWVGEMEEISTFIRDSLGSRGSKEADAIAQTYEGLAQVFQRVADDLRIASESTNGGKDGKGREKEVEDMLQWAKRGGEAVASRKASGR